MGALVTVLWYGISKIDFLGDRRALRRAFCVRGRRAGPAKATRERYDAATRVSPLNLSRGKFAGKQASVSLTLAPIGSLPSSRTPGTRWRKLARIPRGPVMALPFEQTESGAAAI